MKNVIFIFTLLFSLASFNLNAISFENKGGSVQVVMVKHGQPIDTFELPTKYAKPNGKYCYEAAVTVLDVNGSTVLYLQTDKNNIDLSALAKGNYTFVFDLLDFSHSQSITL